MARQRSCGWAQDVDPRDVELGVAVPEEKLREGWIPVLAYLRGLRTQARTRTRPRVGGGGL